MARDDAWLNKLMSSIENDFKDLRKAMQEYKFVVDITTLPSHIKHKIQRKKFVKDTSIHYGEDFTGKHKNSFVILSNVQQLKSIEAIIRDDGEGKNLSSENQASQRRTENFLLQKSRRAENKFGTTIANKTKKSLVMASPEFRLTFTHRVDKRLSTLGMEFNLPEGIEEKFHERLNTQITTSVRKILTDTRKSVVLDKMMQDNVHTIGTAFESGVLLKTRTKTKITKKSNKKTKTTKTYYARLQSAESGMFTSVLSLTATLNALLHDTIQDDFMETSGMAPNRNYLRYQTGRFAKSAKVHTVTHTTPSTVSVVYSYMPEPYNVFLNSAKHGRGRNPERIVEGAIRQIMIQHLHNKFNVVIGKR